MLFGLPVRVMYYKRWVKAPNRKLFLNYIMGLFTLVTFEKKPKSWLPLSFLLHKKVNRFLTIQLSYKRRRYWLNSRNLISWAVVFWNSILFYVGGWFSTPLGSRYKLVGVYLLGPCIFIPNCLLSKYDTKVRWKLPSVLKKGNLGVLVFYRSIFQTNHYSKGRLA